MASNRGIKPGEGAIAKVRADRVERAIEGTGSEKRAQPIDQPNELQKALYRAVPALNPRARGAK